MSIKLCDISNSNIFKYRKQKMYEEWSYNIFLYITIIFRSDRHTLKLIIIIIISINTNNNVKLILV